MQQAGSPHRAQDIWVSGCQRERFATQPSHILAQEIRFGYPTLLVVICQPNVRWLSVCEAGCYQADQMVRFSTGDVEIGEAAAAIRHDLVMLSPEATLDDLRYQVGRLGHYTNDIMPQMQTIVSLFTQSGGSLKVLTNHAVLCADGVMVAAETLRVGDSLVRENGSQDAILRIEADDLYTQVYNVSPATSNLTSNIVIAQGYLNGSGRYQNEYMRYLNGVALCSSLSTALLE